MADNEVKVNLTADAGPLVSELGKAERSVSNLARATREQMAQALPAIERTGTAFSDLARQYLGFHAVVSGVKAFAAMSTEMATLQARLKISTEGVGSAALAYQALFKVAQETRTPLAGMVEIFGRLATAGREIGVSQDRMIAVTRTISQAMTVSGGSAESMRASIVQLGQGLASGTLRGEELNSVMEQTPRLAKAIADGMGVSVGRLRELGATGQLTSQQIVVALEAAAKSVEKDFAQMPLTIAGAMEQLQNSVLNGFKAIGATGGVAAEAIAAIARNLDLVIAAGVTLAATGIAAWFASGAAGAGLLAGALAALTAPVALLAGIIAATGAGLMLLWHRFKEGRENIDLARHSLEVLQARLERQPNNRLLKTALADRRELVAGLELAAQTERERAGQMRGLAQLQAQASEAEKGRIKALADGIDVTRLLSGQSADFQVNLTKLKASYDAGGLSLKEYQTQVGALIDKQGGGKAMTEAATKASHEAAAAYGTLSGRAADLIAKQLEEAASSRAQSDAQKLAIDIDQALGNAKLRLTAIMRAQLVAMRDLALSHDAQAQASANAQAVAAQWAAARAELAKDYEQSASAARKAVEVAEREGEAIGKTADQLAGLSIARDRDRLAVLQGIKAANQNDLVYTREMAAIDAEIEALEKLINLKNGNRLKTGLADSAKQAQDEWKRSAEVIEQSLTDALMRGFEAGEGFGRSLANSLKNLFKTLILRPIIQPIAQTGANAVLGLFGLGGSGMAMAGQGAGIGGGMGNLMQTGSLLSNGYNMLSGGFAGLGNSAAFGAQSMGEWLVMNTSGGMNSLGGSMMANSGAIGGAASLAGGALAGIGIGKAISGQYGLGQSAVGKNGAVVAGTAIGAYIGSIVPVLGTALGAAIGGAIGGLTNRAFGYKPKEVQASGIDISVAGGDVSGSSYHEWKKKGGWLRKDKHGTDYASLGAEAEGGLDAAAAVVYQSVGGLAKAAGLSADGLKTVSHRFRLQLGSDEKANQEAITREFAAYQDQLAAALGDALGPIQRAGETFTATLTRMAAIQTFTTSMAELGGIFAKLSLAGINAREDMFNLAGGLEAFATKARGYVENYYSRDELAGLKSAEIRRVLAEAGITQDFANRDQFRSSVDGLDLGSTAGQQQLAALMNVAESFAGLSDYLIETGQSLSGAAAAAPSTAMIQPLIDGTRAQTAATVSLQERMAAVESAVREIGGAIVGAIGSQSINVYGAANAEVGHVLIPWEPGQGA